MGRKAGVFGIFVFLVALSLTSASCILDAEGFSSGGPPAADEGGSSSGSTSGSQGTSGGSSSGSTSSSSSSGSSTDGGDAGVTGGPNVLQNGDFTIGCASWDVAFGTIAETTLGRTGSGCKLCRGSNFEAFLGQKVTVAVPAGSEWFGEIWLRALPDGGGAPNATDGSLEVGYSDGNTHRGTKSVGPPVTSEWQRIPMIVKPPLAGVEIFFSLRIENGASCVVVDDAVLRRTN